MRARGRHLASLDEVAVPVLVLARQRACLRGSTGYIGSCGAAAGRLRGGPKAPRRPRPHATKAPRQAPRRQGSTAALARDAAPRRWRERRGPGWPKDSLGTRAARHHVERIVREEVAAGRAPAACKVRRPQREPTGEPLCAVTHGITRRLASEPLCVGLLAPDGRAVQVLREGVGARLAEEDDVDTRGVHKRRVTLLGATNGPDELHELGTH